MNATVFYNSASELATCANLFKNTVGTPADPTAVTLLITDPAGVQTTYNWPGGPNTLTHGTAGNFSQDVPCNSAVEGIWVGIWTGTGAVSDVQPFTWPTTPTTLNRYYCSMEEIKSRLTITRTTDDTEILLAIAAASREVDGFCDRYFWRGTDTRTFEPCGLYHADIDDLVSVTTLATDPAGSTAPGGNFPVTWAATDFQLKPVNPVRLGETWPYRRIRAIGSKTFPWIAPVILARNDRVQVTGVFGWPAVPLAVRTATLIAASELLRMKDTPLGGGEPGGLPGEIITTNPRARQLLAPYRRNPMLAA